MVRWLAEFLRPRKIDLMILPVVFYLALNWLAPGSWFTYRCWEDQIVYQIIPHMMFYPNQKIHRQEQGDLAPYTKYARQRDVVWETDRFGVRTSFRGDGAPDILIVGSSYTAGSSLTQDDTLAVVLEKS